MPSEGKGYASRKYTRQTEKFKTCGLSDLLNSIDSIHIRFSTETQAVDIWSQDGKKIQGRITNYTTEAKEDNGRTPKIFCQTIEMDNLLSRELFMTFMNDSIQKIPSQDGIRGWEPGFDGNTYFIEYSTPQEYYAKEY